MRNNQTPNYNPSTRYRSLRMVSKASQGLAESNHNQITNLPITKHKGLVIGGLDIGIYLVIGN